MGLVVDEEGRWAVSAKYKQGDRVVNERDRDRAGTVVKPARTYHIVRFDGEDDDDRVRDDDIRPETAEDIAKREHAKAITAWNNTRPRTTIVGVEISSSWYSREPVGTDIVGRLRTPAEMRTAADDLRQLADWFEQRPSRKTEP